MSDTNKPNLLEGWTAGEATFDPTALVGGMQQVVSGMKSIVSAIGLARAVAAAHQVSVHACERDGKPVAVATLHFDSIEDAQRFGLVALALVTPKPDATAYEFKNDTPNPHG